MKAENQKRGTASATPSLQGSDAEPSAGPSKRRKTAVSIEEGDQRKTESITGLVFSLQGGDAGLSKRRKTELITGFEDGATSSLKRSSKGSGLINMLNTTPEPLTPQEECIKSNSSKLNFYPRKETGTSSLATAAIPSRKPMELPGVYQLKGKAYEIRLNPTALGPNDADFWDMLAEGIKHHSPRFTDEIFGTNVADSLESCHLELAGHLFPTLLQRSGACRYTASKATEQTIAKKSFRGYLKTINENSGKLLAEAADFLDESKRVQITSNDIARTLLRILPTGKPPTVPERAHQDAIDGHTELLARSGEMIRRELLPLAILASNYVDQARRVHADLQIILDFIIPVLKPGQLREVREISKDDSFVAIKDEDNDDMPMSFEGLYTATGDPKGRKTSEGSMIAKDGEAVENPVGTSKEEPLARPETQRSNMTQLPGICVTLLGGHECHCDKCDPRFTREIETKMIRKVYKDNSATISAEARDRITKEVTVRCRERIEKEVLVELEVAKKGEV